MKKLIILLSILVLNENKNKIYCDIKGNVENPGVYEIKDNYTIQNIIDDAGGLKKKSYTKNINLSKKVTDEMVIYIFTNEEINKAEELNNCDCTPIYKYIECKEIEEGKNSIENTTTKINETTVLATTTKSNNTTTKKSNSTQIITTTTKELETSTTTTKKVEELTIVNINTASLEELTSIKGLGIKKAQSIIDYRIMNGSFVTIEDILKVSGIGKSTFEKIKDYIEV